MADGISLSTVTTQLNQVSSDVTAAVTSNGTDTVGNTTLGLIDVAIADLQTARDTLSQFINDSEDNNDVSEGTTT